jgi:NitT/TauT family transport system permease protein
VAAAHSGRAAVLSGGAADFLGVLVGAVVAEFVAGSGGQSAGLAYEILQSSFQLDVPRMFAALLLITLTGVILFAAMVWLQQLLLGHWHESTIERER